VRTLLFSLTTAAEVACARIVLILEILIIDRVIQGEVCTSVELLPALTARFAIAGIPQANSSDSASHPVVGTPPKTVAPVLLNAAFSWIAANSVRLFESVSWAVPIAVTILRNVAVRARTSFCTAESGLAV